MLSRREKGKGRLTDEQLSELQSQDLNSLQFYRISKQHQAIERFFRMYDAGMDFDASYMRDRTSQETWLLLNQLSATIAMDCIADIARIGEDKDLSFEDLRQTFGRIMASQVNGKLTLVPVKNPVQKLIAKLDFQIDTFDLYAMT